MKGNDNGNNFNVDTNNVGVNSLLFILSGCC